MKLQCCKENLQPIPFVPTKTLDFSKHEQLLKRLGLWDFVHIEFDQVIRNDLLAQLIVSYKKDQSSTVNDFKIKVNRADLGRALKLPPLPLVHPNVVVDAQEVVLSEESISFLDDFVSNWFLLHEEKEEEEDMWIMPDEVLNNTRFIKEGQPEKVDWPGLIWFMVEKELSQGTKLKSCYYASHLQYLMRSQKDVLFKEEAPKVVVVEKSNEENADDEEDVMDFSNSKVSHIDTPSMFGNSCKRALSHVVEEEEEEEDDIQHDIFGGRMRNNGYWENKPSNLDLDYCMEQVNSLAAKARLIHAQKHEESMNAQMNQQYLMSELQQRDDMIATLQNKCEEIQRREIEMYKLEHELRMMSNLLVGYRTALKQTQREFSEYRKHCPGPEEPLYKDVPGGGGLVLSTWELEKLRLEEREEEEKKLRMFIEELIKKFEGSCIATLEVSLEKVHLLDKRLLKLEEEFKLLKGGGGHVLSTVELEKLRLAREEEEKMQRRFFEEQMKKFEGICIAPLEVSLEKVHLLDERLLKLEEDFKILKEIFALFGN